jgi:hypothetical protein
MLYSIWLSDTTPSRHRADRLESLAPLDAPLSASRRNEEARWRTVSRILEWASITTLVLVLAWRPSAGRHLALDLVVCAGVGVLALTVMLRRDLAFHPAAAGVFGRPTGLRP